MKSPVCALLGALFLASRRSVLGLLLGGLGCILAALWFASRLPGLREAVRPIYI